MFLTPTWRIQKWRILFKLTIPAERLVGGVIIGNLCGEPPLFGVRYRPCGLRRRRGCTLSPARQDFVRQLLNHDGVCVGVRARPKDECAD